ncbi:hypothetical protein ACFVH6_45115 [Spirillospora sp. NPDC127200]
MDAAVFDAVTLERLRRLGVRPGMRCLAVGSGGVAEALGCVVVDGGEARPGGGFDLVLARLALADRPARHGALARLARALRPGGLLLVEEVDGTWTPPVLAAPEPPAEQLHGLFFAALAASTAADGGDPAWAASVYGALHGLGLTGLGAVAHAEVWRGGGPGCAALRSLAARRRDALTATGLVTGAELDGYARLLADPAFAAASPLVIAVWGRRR